jgi:prepilin-type N-terminal cleavage/methylation domain-containing protein
MITSAPVTSPRRAGFTLTEVIVATALTGLVLAGVLSAFLFIGRTGFRASSVSEMENDVRRGLEVFAQDARNASDVHWNNGQSLTLLLPAGAVTYAYDSAPNSDTAGTFYRVDGDASSGQPRRVLVRNVAPDFAFMRYKLEQPGVPDNAAANDLETKQIQVAFRAQRPSVATATVSQQAFSARYLLRNKRVSN